MESIGAWLARLGLEQYAEVFAANDIDPEVMSSLTESDLAELGVSMGHRKRILKAVAAPAAPAMPASPPPDAAAERGERRQLTVMFCDLVGSTALAERLDPEDLREIVRTYQRCASAEIATYGGHVAQLLGDGLLVYFGHPQAHEDDAERAVHAALGIIDALDRIDLGPSMPAETRCAVRIGIHTGLIVIADMGGEARQETLALGETPNVAARLQAIAAPGTIVISDQTQRLVAGSFLLEDLGPQGLKGIREPVRAWAVSGPSNATSRFEAATRSGLTSFVGRDEETAHIVRCWQRAASGHGQVVLLTGEAGIGKSRILMEVRQRLGTAGLNALQLQCSPYHLDSAYHPITQELARLLRFERDDSPAARRHRLDALVVHRLRRPIEDGALLASVLSIESDDSQASTALPALRQKRESIRALVDLVEAMAHRAPTLVLFEDAHWSDRTTLEALDELIDRVGAMRVLVIVTCRPDFHPAWDHRGQVSVLRLSRLTPEDSAALVSRVTGQFALPPGVTSQIIEKADGVPLFVEELTKFLLESTEGRRGAMGVEYGATPGDATIPATLRDSLMARLDRVAHVKHIAQIGAAIGRDFSDDLIRAVAAMPTAALDRALAALIDSGLAVQTRRGNDVVYSFKHSLVQEVAYESLLKKSRQELHQAIVGVLETRYPELRTTDPALFARHMTAAGLIEAAIPYWRAAADRSLSRMALWEAASQLKQGLALVMSRPPSLERDRAELPFRALLGTSHMLAKGWGAAEVELAYGRANELCTSIADVDETIWPSWGVWVFNHVRGHIARAQSIAEEVAQIATASGGRPAQLVAHMMLGQGCLFAAQFDRAREHFALSTQRYLPDVDRALINLYSMDLLVVLDVHDAHRLWLQGFTDEAIALVDRGVAHAASLNHPYSHAWALIWGSVPHACTTLVPTALENIERGMAIADEFGFAYLSAIGAMLRGWCVAQLHDLAGGIEQMQSGLAAFAATGAAIAVPFFKALLAQLLGASGRKADGLALLDEATEQMEAWGERWQEPEMHRALGLLHMAEPNADFALAEALFRRGLDIAAEQRAPGWTPRLSAPLGELLRAQGRHDEADALLDHTLA